MLKRFYNWLTDDHVLFEPNPDIARFWMRCTLCGRVLPHYRGCMTAEERKRGCRVGCRCGGDHSRYARVGAIYGFVYLLFCLMWRKWVRGYKFWDPRMPARKTAPPTAEEYVHEQANRGAQLGGVA